VAQVSEQVVAPEELALPGNEPAATAEAVADSAAAEIAAPVEADGEAAAAVEA